MLFNTLQKLWNWLFNKCQPGRTLVFPKGTVVEFNGIPCELLQDTPYESRQIGAASPRRKNL